MIKGYLHDYCSVNGTAVIHICGIVILRVYASSQILCGLVRSLLLIQSVNQGQHESKDSGWIWVLCHDHKPCFWPGKEKNYFEIDRMYAYNGF